MFCDAKWFCLSSIKIAFSLGLLSILTYLDEFRCKKIIQGSTRYQTRIGSHSFVPIALSDLVILFNGYDHIPLFMPSFDIPVCLDNFL
jgi:hypothetical protein